MSWNFKVVSGNRCPRQFEYHPTRRGMVFGTITGEICAIDIYQGESRDNTCEEGSDIEPVPIKSLGFYGKNKNDTMLGLCWLKPQASDMGVDCGSIYGESRGNSNLFLSGSSQGRVCLGNASCEYDPFNRDSYSIVHDYPVFNRLTSVHVNCSNKLLLLSGYSPGVNIVDMETSQMVRKYDNIHKDHVNISRFSNLSPHLFATSSFDGTMKTWDLRQSSAGINSETGRPEYRPVYSVSCNSGVVMINFSQDDNFILASALDNEINQFLFLDGRKHLTYNLPKTGLKSNFTRAYYSASGRHTLTGACEESTVKIMDTFTGEQVSTVELYPGKKDKSIYIQSLRGCPTDEDQICVLANYRDMQNRELIMVTRDRRAERERALDCALSYAGSGSDSGKTNAAEDAATRSVAHWFDASIREAAPVASLEEIDTAMVTAISAGDTTTADNGPERNAASELVAGEEEPEIRQNNSLMTCYSAQYGEDMRGLCRFCTGLVRGYTFWPAADGRNGGDRGGGVGGEGAHKPPLRAAQLELYAADGVQARDCADIVVLMHANPCLPNETRLARSGLFLLPVHTFVLEARCPSLYQLLLHQQGAKATTAGVTSASLCFGTDARENVELPVLDISAPCDGAPWATTPEIPEDLLHLLPLLVDYLYTGHKSLDLITLRYYCLQRIVREDGGKHSLTALLIPYVGEVLRAEIADFVQYATKEGRDMDVCDADELNDSGSRAYRANATRGMFLSVQDNAEVELLLKVCVDDHCWRQSTVLAVNCVRTGEQLLRLAQSLRLTGLVSVISRILEHGMCPLNAICIYDTAVRYGCAELSEVALRFIASHSGILSRQITMWPEVAAAVAHLSAQHLAQVVMREHFRERKNASERKHTGRHRRSTFDQLMQSLLGSPDLDDDEDEAELAEDYSSDDEEQVAEAAEVELWQQEEVPYLPAEQMRTVQPGAASAAAASALALASEVVHVQRPATVCLPRYIGTTMTAMLQDNVLFLGGQNLERLHTYGNRILTYNHAEKIFRHISTGGTHLPKCGYMSCVNALQRSRPTHILVMGAKVKKAESSAHHTSLPQHLRTMRSASDSAWTSMHPRNPGGTDASAIANGAGRKGWGDLIGMTVDSAGPVSIIQNRLLNIWNLNADREELSQPTAAAYAAEVTAALSSLNTAVDEDGNAVKLPRAQELMKRMGLVFELDCETLTWRSPSVEMEAATRFNAYTMQNAALRMQREDEIEVLHDALRHRFAQAIAPLYQEDVSYRCSECLFSTFPATVCACNAAKSKSAADRGLEKTWLVQFGGYCEKTESIIADLHVMVCQRKRPGQLGAEVDGAARNSFSYKWVKASASGVIPSARFSHTATVIPANPTIMTRSCSARLHSRVLLYGGVYAVNMPALASLRINCSGDASPSKTPAMTAEYGHYAHWEVVESSGRAPPPTQGHTLVHIPDSDLCVLCGGAFTGAEGTQNNSCNPDTWLLRVVDVVTVADAANPSDTMLRVQWKLLISNGIPPTLRSRHSCFVVPRREGSADEETAEIFIFGGVDEAKLQRRQARRAVVEPDFDQEIKDSVLHTLVISRSVKPNTHPKWLRCSTGVLQDPSEPSIEARMISQLLYFQTDPSVQVAECSLSADMMQLMRAAFRLDSAASTGGAEDPMQAECDDAEEHGDQRLQRMIAEFEAHCGADLEATATRDPSDAVPVQSPSLTLDLCNQNEAGGSITTTSFGVHESLLRKRCAWFTTLLTSNMRGGAQDLPGHITLYDVDPVAFRLLLLYVYADALMICSLHDVVAVLELANQFDLASLAQKCEGVLVRLTTLQNVCELLDYSDSLNLTILKASCIALILRDVVEDGNSRGRDYAAQLFAGLSPPECAADAPGSTAGGAELRHSALGMPDAALDPHRALLEEFQQLSVELRLEVWGVYLRTEQVYAARTNIK